MFRGWVGHDDGDVSNQEFPERYRSDDHGREGVSTEHAKEDKYPESRIAAIRAAKAGELWENHVRNSQTSTKVPLSDDYTTQIFLVGDNCEKVDCVGETGTVLSSVISSHPASTLI